MQSCYSRNIDSRYGISLKLSILMGCVMIITHSAPCEKCVYAIAGNKNSFTMHSW